MTRMTKEFSLVLLGAGILTAGAFAWPEQDLAEAANREAARQVAAAPGGATHRHGFIFIHTGRLGAGGSGRSGMVNVSRGGFGRTGGAISVPT